MMTIGEAEHLGAHALEEISFAEQQLVRNLTSGGLEHETNYWKSYLRCWEGALEACVDTLSAPR
jgi:hypothetical protein